MNGLWAGMMLVGIVWGIFHGTLAEVTDGAIKSAGEAVSLCITMLGVMSLWTGILEIGNRAGLIEMCIRDSCYGGWKGCRISRADIYDRLGESHV